MTEPNAENFIAHVPVAMIAIAPDQKVAFANHAAELFFGTSIRRLVGQKIDNIVRFESLVLQKSLASDVEDISARAMAASILTIGGSSASESTRTGLQRVVDVSVTSVTGFPDWRVATLTDSHSSKMFDGDLHDSKHLSTIRAPEVLSHEIKNPLAGIKGAAQLLDRTLEGSGKDLTSLIILEVDRIAALIDQMNHLSTTQPATIAPANIHQLIDKACRSVEAATEKNMIITAEYDPSLPDVMVDEGAVMQIMVNLLKNGIDATHDANDPKLTVKTSFVFGGAITTPDDNRLKRLPVEVSVIDNGPGVPANIGSELFSPFVSGKKEGQGLGLALVKKLVRDMNGRISYERDTVKQLSIFKLLLPVAEKRN